MMIRFVSSTRSRVCSSQVLLGRQASCETRLNTNTAIRRHFRQVSTATSFVRSSSVTTMSLNNNSVSSCTNAPQGRSFSTFQRLVDVVLQRPNPLVETITAATKQQTDEIITTPDFQRMEPHHFESAAKQIQLEYDQAMKVLEQSIIEKETKKEVLTYESVVVELLRIETPMRLLQRYLQLFYQLQKDPITQIACTKAGSLLQFHHDSESLSSSSSTTTALQNALQHVYNFEINRNNDINDGDHELKQHEERVRVLQLLLNRYNVVLHNTTTNNNEDDSEEVQDKLQSIEIAMKDLESKFIQYIEEQQMIQIGQAAPPKSSSSWSTRDKIQDMYYLLALKREESKLLGYNDHVDMIFQTQNRMATNMQQVQDLHEEIMTCFNKDTIDTTDDKYAYLQDVGASGGSGAVDDEATDLRTYLTLDGALGGMFGLSRALFGLRIKEEENKDKVNGWHPEVRLFHVYEEEEKEETQQENQDDSSASSSSSSYVGSFYLDPYRRPLKQYRNFTGTLLERTETTPHPLLYMNLTIRPPVWDHMPTDISFDDTLALFHEFGHCLQFLLTKDTVHGAVDATEQQVLVPMDVEEVVPQFMEHWLYEESVLQSLAHLSQSSTSIPSELITKLQQRRSKQKKYELLERIFLSELEFAILSASSSEDESIVGIQKQMADTYMSHNPFPKSDISPLMDVMTNNLVTGKPVGHYRYLWSDVMSADIFHVFTQVGLSNENEIKQLGRKFRHAFLDFSPGTAAAADNVDSRFHEFCGRDTPMSAQTMLQMHGLSKKNEISK